MKGNASSNKSLHRSAKQLLSCLACVLKFGLRVGGFALGELRRSMPHGKIQVLCIMKRIALSISFLISASTIFVFGQSNSWKGLTPLLSTRADVEKLLGKPKEDKYSCCRYEMPNENVSISYATDTCDEGWNVPKDTVLSLSVSPNSDVGKSFEELKLDKNKFSMTGDDAFFGTWTNPEQGLQYYFSNIDREFRSFSYLPKRSDNNLRCDGFPPFAPEGRHYSFERFSFQNKSLSKKGNLYRIYASLDNFIIQNTSNGNHYKGFVLVYFDDKLSLKQYKSLLDKLKAHIFKVRKTSAELITIIEGGMKEEAEIELYLLPKEYKPPAPNPTLPSPQFMKRQ